MIIPFGHLIHLVFRETNLEIFYRKIQILKEKPWKSKTDDKTTLDFS